MTFQPGVSGNAGGRPKRKIVSEEVSLVLMQLDDRSGKTRIRKIVEAVAAKADEGDVQAFNALADRAEGKVPQAIEGKLEHGIDDSIAGLLQRIGEGGRRIHDRDR